MGAIKIVGRRALIGRGFLGSVLDSPGRFTDRFHSKNIDRLEGSFDLIVIAAPSAAKWFVNEHPDLDSVACQEIVSALQRTSARRVVLLSSIDAGREIAGIYGKHRLMLERKMPEHAAIIRLPALYGDGLRKNALFDLMNSKPVPNQIYQWYNVADLWGNVQTVVRGQLWRPYSAPLSMWEIAERLGVTDLISGPHDPKKEYNEPGPHTMSSLEVLEDIVRWVNASRA